MAKKTFAICQIVNSKKTKFDIFRRSFESIYNRSGLESSQFDYFITFNANSISQEVSKYIVSLAKFHNVYVSCGDGIWAHDVNKCIEKCINGYEYFAQFHDDVIVHSKDWAKGIIDSTSSIKKIGFITSTDITHESVCFPITPVRDGYYIDAFDGSFRSGTMFQFHNFERDWYKKNNACDYVFFGKFDYPKGPVRVLSTWSDVMIARTRVLEVLPRFKDWTPFTLLNEFDMNLEATLRGFYNCWLPSFKTEHYRESRLSDTRSIDLIAKYRDVAHLKFMEKWGFRSKPSKDEVPFIKQAVGNTPIDEFVDNSYSFDWKYF